jgi:RHS repeat-associated protein
VQYRDKVYYGKVKQPDLLVSVKDGFNAETKIEYSTLVDAANNGSPLYTPDVTVPSFPLAPAGRSMQVVTKVSRSDGAAGYNDRYFNYTGAKIDLQGRGFLGFANIKETDVAKGIVITTDYRQAFPYSGRVDTATVASTSGELISSTKNVYTIQSDNARFPHIDYSIQKVFQLLTTSITSPISVTKTSSTYDACGNVAGQTTETGTGVTGASITGTLSIQTVINTVDRYDTADCSDDFVSLRTQTLSKTSASDDLKTIVTQFTPNSTAYNAIKEVLVLTAYKGTAQEKTTTLHRTLWGSVDSSAEVAKDINSGTTSTRSVASSSFSNLIYPSTITNTLSTGDHVTTVGYDRRFGEQNAITLPDGQPTSRVYDALGRLTQETLADGTLREIISFYCGNITAISCPSGGAYGVATRVTNPAKLGYLGEPLTIVYYDSLQRETRRSVYSMDGNAINTDRVYYANGKLQKVSAPYLSGGSGLQVHWTTYSNYDALGRAHTVSQPDDGSQSTSFELFGSLVRATTTIFVTGSGVNDSQITQRYTNALGQVTQVVDANNTPVDYTYNSLGSLATTMVNNNSKTLISLDYDIQGNKTYISDPDAGPINFEYNGFGELRRQTWRLGDSTYNKSMVLSYDQLGRQIQRDDTPASGQGAATSYSWAWDSKKKGHLDSETSPNKTVTYNYDANARLLSQITNITGLGSRTFTYGYDEFSRVNSVIYPNDFTMIREYHAAGMAVKTYDATDAANPKVLWALGNNIDNRGNFNNYLWGNGVVTKSGFNEKSGRLASITSGRLSNTNTVSNLYGDIQALSYDYDSMGNLHSRTSQRTDTNGAALPEYEREEFTYDKLNRLKTSTTGLLFTRLNEYQYDNLGNLTSRSSKMNGTSVNEDVGVLSYVPTAANNAGVHAVTAAGVLSYQYDKYGNMTSRGSDSIAYDVFNKPIRMSGGGSTTTIDYDANHERYREVVVSTGTTVSYSIGGGLYEEVVEGNKVTQKAYIDGVILNSRVLNSGVQASNDTLYIHTDNMGSSEAISNQFGAFVSRMSFSDWGKRQKSDWKNGSPTESFPTMNGYTGHHEMDQHNLVHMGGRVYDPAIGRFLSADLLIQSPYSSQSFNRYSYVSNNPMSNMDPTGYAGENWGCMNYLSNMGTPDASQHAETWGCPGAGGDNSGAMDSYLHQHGPSNIDVTAPETFNRQNLWDEANNQYGYASSPQRMNKLFDNDDSDVVTEIVVTGCCKNGKGTSLSVDERIGAVASEFPGAGIRITGRARTVDEQARLMAQRIRVNETQFTETYTPRPHTQEMKAWVRAHPDATMSETSQAFSGIIRRALATGAAVSNHLSDTARDISIPHGSRIEQNQVEARFNEQGVHVLRETDAVGGPHWHLDF